MGEVETESLVHVKFILPTCCRDDCVGARYSILKKPSGVSLGGFTKLYNFSFKIRDILSATSASSGVHRINNYDALFVRNISSVFFL